MRALSYQGPYKLTIENKPDPRIEHPQDAVLRVTVAIFGCDPVGLFAMRSAWLMGAGRVIAVDYVPYRLEFAEADARVETGRGRDDRRGGARGLGFGRSADSRREGEADGRVDLRSEHGDPRHPPRAATSRSSGSTGRGATWSTSARR